MVVENDRDEMDPLDLSTLNLTPTVYVTGWGEWLRLIVW